jgi:D-sedoheptulose 7-phosphate isomerase
MSILQKSVADAVATFQRLGEFEKPVQDAAAMILRCLLDGKKLLVCGNGGSAADGADFSTEFTCRFMGDRRPYPAMNLAVGGSFVTATGNDYSFDEIFARQIHAFGKTGDVLVAITTSGNSKNILRALAEAKLRGVQSIALLGKDGGKARGLADIEFIVPSQITARIQEAHKFLLHVICEIVDRELPRE